MFVIKCLSTAIIIAHLGRYKTQAAEPSYKKLSKEDIEFFFTDEKPPNYSVVNIRARTREVRSTDSVTLNPGRLDLTLEDEKGKFELELHPSNEIISPRFKLVVRGVDGKIESENEGFPRKECLYTGSVKGKFGTTAAALSTCDGKGFAEEAGESAGRARRDCLTVPVKPENMAEEVGKSAGTAVGLFETGGTVPAVKPENMTGVFIDGEHSHLIRPLNTTTRSRLKREVGQDSDDVNEDGLHIIHPASGGDSKCAIHNLRAMMAPSIVVELPQSEDAEDNIWEEFYTNNEEKEEEVDESQTIVEEHHHSITKRQSSKKYTIETAVFTDEAMYKFIKDQEGTTKAVEELENIVLAIMNGVNIIYTAPSMRTRISVEVVRLEIMKSSDILIDPASGDISLYLSNFCIWQHRQLKKSTSSEKWDHGLLLSGIDLWDIEPSQDKVIGLAWVGGMCNSFYSCTINEGTSFEAQFVIAHEMGHNLNMSHDGSEIDGNFCPRDNFLMSPSTGPGKLSWSMCSNRELENFLEKGPKVGCLVKTRQAKAYPSQEKLPGQVYDIKDQCEYAYGESFKPYVTSKGPYEAVCRELWCQNKTHALRSHPALEGSTCDQNKYCINGMCQRKLNIPSATIPEKPSTDTSVTPRRDDSSFGFTDFIKNIKNLFKKYFLLTNDGPQAHLLHLPEWRLINLSKCTVRCGGGWKEGEVVCIRDNENIILKDDECDAQRKPPSITSCNTFPCIT